MKFRKKPVVIEAVLWNGYSNNIGLTNGKNGSEARYELPDWMPAVTSVLAEQASDQSVAIDVPVGEVHRTPQEDD